MGSTSPREKGSRHFSSSMKEGISPTKGKRKYSLEEGVSKEKGESRSYVSELLIRYLRAERVSHSHRHCDACSYDIFFCVLSLDGTGVEDVVNVWAALKWYTCKF